MKREKNPLFCGIVRNTGKIPFSRFLISSHTIFQDSTIFFNVMTMMRHTKSVERTRKDMKNEKLRNQSCFDFSRKFSSVNETLIFNFLTLHSDLVGPFFLLDTLQQCENLSFHKFSMRSRGKLLLTSFFACGEAYEDEKLVGWWAR